MPEDLMRYDLLAQEALRGVVRAALRQVVRNRNQLPGDHHFFIAFDTRYPGVKLSERIQTKYPREMTIVLQHQFWNLAVHDTEFEIELSFDHVPEKLVVPFNAIKGFLDPHVQFGLQFETVKTEEMAEAKPASEIEKPAAKVPAAVPPPEVAATAAASDAARVVSLDSFRKK
ncbi:MAG: SspB family protein [Parvibaculaceae bacterium]